MPAVRAFAALVLVGFMGTWLSQAPTTNTRPPVHHRAPATTTTVVVTTTSTTVPPAPRVLQARASRGAPRPPLHGPPDQATMDRVVAAIRSYPDWDADLMTMVGRCESGLNPYAVNGRSGATGIFQIIGATPGLIEEHVALAHSIWIRRGLSPWSASRSCWS